MGAVVSMISDKVTVISGRERMGLGCYRMSGSEVTDTEPWRTVTDFARTTCQVWATASRGMIRGQGVI